MRAHENSAVAESKGARGQSGQARRDSDRQREFRRTFRGAGFDAEKRSRRDCGDRYRQTTPAGAACDREHASQVMVHGTTLIVRIIATVFVLSGIVMDMMMVDVSDPSGLSKVGGNILFALEGVLDLGANQRRDTDDLGQQKEPKEQRTKTAQLSQ
jgi:hypothetical protein